MQTRSRFLDQKRSEEKVNLSVSEVVRFIQAAHVGQYTDWPFEQRGAIILHAYPDQLKSTLVDSAFRHYGDSERLSDLNGTQLDTHRGDLLKGSIKTFVFPEFQKIWERDERTSANVEGNIRSLIEEGWSSLPNRAGRRGGLPARAMCVLCVTPEFLDSRIEQWKINGMLRRSLVLSWKVDDSEMNHIWDAIAEGKLFRYSEDSYIPYPDGRVPYVTTKEEGDWIKSYVKKRRGGTSRQVLLHRTFNCLKWYYTTFRSKEGVDEATRLFRSVLSIEGDSIVGELVLRRTPQELRLAQA